MNIKEWFKQIAIKYTLKGFSKACQKMIDKGISIDLDKDDINDLKEWKDWTDKAIEVQEINESFGE